MTELAISFTAPARPDAERHVHVVPGGGFGEVDLLRIGHWTLSAYWERTREDRAPRLKEQLLDWGIEYEVELGFGRSRVWFPPSGFLGSRLVRVQEDGAVVVELRDRSRGGGVPNTPSYSYGPLSTRCAIRFSRENALKLAAKIRSLQYDALDVLNALGVRVHVELDEPKSYWYGKGPGASSESAVDADYPGGLPRAG